MCIYQREEDPLTEGLEGLLLLPLPNLDGVVPDALAGMHSNWTTVAHYISLEDHNGPLGFDTILRG